MKHVVYPGHGVGRITATETRTVLGCRTEFYLVEILGSGMKILVPVKSAGEVGLREVMSPETAAECLSILESKQEVSHDTWNRRYREYMELIKTGSPLDIARVVSCLEALKIDKELSFGERKMLDAARSMLNTELKIVLGA